MGSPSAVPLILLLTMAAGGCASTGATPRPFPMPGGSAGMPAGAGGSTRAPERSPSGASEGYAVSGTALALRGTPYRNGGSDPQHGFDCSGFTQYVFGRHGVSLPRAVADQFRVGAAVEPADVAAGDLIFFTTTAPGPTHVGISLGGDEFVHAPSSTGVVRVERLTSPYWSHRFIAAHRIR